MHSAGTRSPFLLRHYSGTEQPQSLIPLSFRLPAPQSFFPQDVFPPPHTCSAHSQVLKALEDVYLDTREAVYVFPLFPSYNRKLEAPNQNMRVMHAAEVTDGPARTAARARPLPLTHFCSLSFWNKSPFSFAAAHAGGLRESQRVPAIAGAVRVPTTNKRDYLSHAQRPLKGPNCSKTLKRSVSCQVKQLYDRR